MKVATLKKYAHLIARQGANIQKGQEVFITCELDQPEFIKILVEECYKCGAKSVNVDWNYQPLTQIHVKHKSIKTLSVLEPYVEAKWAHMAKVLPCRIYIMSEDPDGLKKMDMEKYMKGYQKRYPQIKKYRDQMETKYQWCIAAVPGQAWAKKVFPYLPKKKAEEKLWDCILSCARCTEDPIKAWEDHNNDLHRRCDYLNSLGITSMHYTSKNGTDFTVGLIDGSCFRGGADKTVSGISYNPNMPSEECFISPMKGKAEGIVYSTKPLSYNGILIENFWIKFKDGKAVEWNAEKNNEALSTIINMDENSCYLGECALVPYDSPIQNSKVLFYNTLFDENAACHLALGMGFDDTLDGFENMTHEECVAKGVNDSTVHEDFMIGSADMNITALTKEGKVVEIFKNGNWAF